MTPKGSVAAGPATQPADKPRHILVAEVLRAHGLRGEVQVRLLADSWEALGRPAALYVEAEGGGAGAAPRPLAVEGMRGGGARLILKLAGVETRESAAALAGRRLGIPRAAAPPLPEGRYYHYDILGLTVVGPSGRDLGRVAEILSSAGNDVYVVRGPRGEWLLPATRALVAAVDLEAGVLRVRDVSDLLEG
ncbi:MAG TPA: ribosome maturation factor RimM [Candidatus Methylomirabilis sp.]